MNRKIKIKVIKKDEMRTSDAPVITEIPPELEDDSKLASTVSDWVNDFKQRRREETASAMEQFYS
jgi:hypothetical protein